MLMIHDRTGIKKSEDENKGKKKKVYFSSSIF